MATPLRISSRKSHGDNAGGRKKVHFGLGDACAEGPLKVPKLALAARKWRPRSSTWSRR